MTYQQKTWTFTGRVWCSEGYVLKIVLINPPQTIYPKSTSPSAGPPLGLLYIAGMLDTSADDLVLLDAMIEDPCSTMHEDGSVTLGMTQDQIAERIAGLDPDIVAITNPFTPQIDNAYRTAESVKCVGRDIVTIIGGPHVTIKPEEVLKECTALDIAVIGEGEFTFRDIVNTLREGRDLSGIKGIAYRFGDKIVLNERREFVSDLDDIPFPAYGLADMDRYFASGLRTRASSRARPVSLITSRGCPFNCIFCSIHLHMGRKWRAHSVRYVLDHIAYLVDRYQIDHIHFEDDNLTFDRQRFESILDGLLGRDLKISWDTPNGVRADLLDFELIRKMKSAGCAGLTIGIESGVQTTLEKIIHKKLRLEKVVEVAGFCKTLNLPLNGFYIIGFPGETRQDMQKTVDFAVFLKKNYNVGMNLFIAAPFFGTDLYNLCEEQGYFSREVTPVSLAVAVQYWGTGLIRTSEFSETDVKKISDSAMKKYSRLAVRDYLKNPASTIRMALLHPKDACRFIANLLGKK